MKKILFIMAMVVNAGVIYLSTWLFMQANTSEVIETFNEEVMWLEQYIEVKRPLPEVRYVSPLFLRLLTGKDNVYGAYRDDRIYLSNEKMDERKQIYIHELIHHSGYLECIAYTLQITWMMEKGITDTQKFWNVGKVKCEEEGYFRRSE